MVRSLAEADAATALAASRPHIVPSELAAAAHEDKLRAIGAEARSSFEAAHGASPNGLVSSPWWLLNLAEVEIEAGDKAGARDTLTAAQAIPGNNPAGLPGTTEGRLAMLWVRAGDSATAHRYAESISKPADRLSALGEYGAALAHAGDLAGANVAMETVARAPEPEDDSATRPAVGQIALATMPPRDLAIRKIGTALAEKHDMRGALRAASLLTEDRLHAGLLADIASKQCTDRDGGAFETLRLADEAVHGLKDPGHFGPVDTFVYALAACGDVARAADVARELAPKRTAMVLGQVAGLLMEHGDRDRSRQVDAVNVDALTDVYGLLNLAKREIARGDVELAKPHIAGASAMTLEAVRSKRVAGRPLHEILDALSPVASIADTQATVGAYADAIHTIEVEDPINRPQFFVSLVAAAVTRHDGNGVKESLRTVFNAARQANVEFPLNHLTHLVASLANAGYFAEARQILGLVPQSGRQSEMFAGAQAALGDIDGARTTLYALDLTDAQRTQSLVRIALGRHDLASALDALKGGAPDDALSSIASAQAKNGDLTAAMATAWQIRGLGLRAETLVALLKALKRS
jgi:hypothetical protein